MTNELNQPAGTIALVTPTGETIGLYKLATDNDGNFLYEDIDGNRKDIPSNYRIKVITTQQHPTTEWHNLTEQVLAGANIDWEEIDGVSAQLRKIDKAKRVYVDIQELKACVHPPYRITHFKMAPATGYWDEMVGAATGVDGWTLWIDRPVPIKNKTAAQLPVGTYFKGKAEWTTGDITGLYVIGESAQGKFILNGHDYLPCAGEPHQWIVTQELGTFQPTN